MDKKITSPADAIRGLADALETFGPETTEAEMAPAISEVIGRATPEAAAATLVVLVDALDRLRRHPTPAQGAEELRRLADEIDPPVEVNVIPLPDGCWSLGDPPPEGPPFSKATGGRWPTSVAPPTPSRATPQKNLRRPP